MNRIDSHQHFWIFDPVRDSWINEEMAVIQRDFSPVDLAPVLTSHGLDGCVAVQAVQEESENDFLLTHAETSSIVKGIVGWVDLRAENIEERLAHYAKFSKIKGFRHVLQGEEDRALMLKPAFQRGIASLAKHNFTYDILIFSDQLYYAAELANNFPEQSFVLDHIAKPLIKEGKIDEWAKGIQALAKQQNVYCKVSGMVTEADWKQWKIEDFTPYLDVVFDAFGAERLLFGSDWPVCMVAGGYDKMIAIVEEYTNKHLNEQQKMLFWGGNATKFYSL